jgi:minor extracellular serine protease Vpr
VTPSNPVHRGDVLVIYATGLGRTNPLIPAGQPAPTDQLASTQIPVVVTLGGIQQQVLFAGLAPGLVGVYQINVQITRSVPEGLSVPLVISQGGGSTSFVVRVVN